jgi:hypothetical protein
MARADYYVNNRLPSDDQGVNMGLARRLAALLGAVLLVSTLGAGSESPAAAAARKTQYVRYAGASCLGRNGEYHVCAPWRLVLRSGRVIRLTEARVFATADHKGRAPFGLSPHGSQAAYFRLRDGALLVRDVTSGKVRVVPGITWSPNQPRISLSPAARFIVVQRDFGGPRQLLDSITGQVVHTLPAGEHPVSFSPDNRYMITARPIAGGVGYSAVVYSTAIWSVVHRGARAGALGMDGTTIAYIADWNTKHPSIRIVNVVTGAPTRAPIPIPAGEFPHWAIWDRAGHLDLLTHVTSRSAGYRTTFRWRRANAGMRILDTFVNRTSDEIDTIAGLPDY